MRPTWRRDRRHVGGLEVAAKRAAVFRPGRRGGPEKDAHALPVQAAGRLRRAGEEGELDEKVRVSPACPICPLFISRLSLYIVGILLDLTIVKKKIGQVGQMASNPCAPTLCGVLFSKSKKDMIMLHVWKALIRQGF